MMAGWVSAGFQSVCPVHLNFLFFVSFYIRSCLVHSQSVVLGTLFDHFMCKIIRRHLLMNVGMYMFWSSEIDIKGTINMNLKSKIKLHDTTNKIYIRRIYIPRPYLFTEVHGRFFCNATPGRNIIQNTLPFTYWQIIFYFKHQSNTNIYPNVNLNEQLIKRIRILRSSSFPKHKLVTEKTVATTVATASRRLKYVFVQFSIQSLALLSALYNLLPGRPVQPNIISNSPSNIRPLCK